MGNRVRKMIREDVGNGCFCILVDEARDASHREQMTIILRYVNSCGVLTERFFAIKSVISTTSLNLKNEISDILVRFDLDLSKLRGQGYDGANNMRGTWNGLQALFLRDYPCAYYVHCFAHRLQLVLVYAAKDVSVIWEFFSQRIEVERMLETGERESGSGANQIGNLQRAGATRWSSHYDSIKSLIDMFTATCKVLEYLQEHCPKVSSRAEVCGVYRHFACFEFVFSLLLMHKVMGITSILCQGLQKKSLDILLVAMRYVSTTQLILGELRENGWEDFLEEVKEFCSKHEIHVPELNSKYMVGRCRKQTTVEHHYHFDVFNEAIDFVLVELRTRFNDKSMELLSLSASLDPKNSYESFNADAICTLARKFYPEDFSSQDIRALEFELQHYVHDVIPDTKFQVATLVELCEELTKSRRSDSYVMMSRLIRLVLILPVSTATAERSFSAMKLLKTTLRNKMADDFLADCMMLYIERDLTLSIDVDYIVDEFFASKPRRGQI
ncbi:unnamed protein product [Cuscuta epithymum]|uniref:HAT C-terminal dimerisation domain-containing protein n=1 Tax=Cuscuta epithymum TaxID=186058 RepID=A0AAV0DNM7_9ASTE|nr:unnamed protein product [Cuscuta epithymum]